MKPPLLKLNVESFHFLNGADLKQINACDGSQSAANELVGNNPHADHRARQAGTAASVTKPSILQNFTIL